MFGIKTVAFTLLFKTSLCEMSTLFAIKNAQVSDKKVLLNLMQCGRLNQKFDTAALQFSASDTTRCDSLKSSWFDSPVYERGFGYAIKRQNVEDFSATGGMRASNVEPFGRKLPLPLETGVLITIDLVPYFDHWLAFNMKTANNAIFIHLVFNKIQNNTRVEDKADPKAEAFQNTKTFQGCPL